MKKINQNRVIEQLDLHPFGKKGWMRSSLCICPLCSRFDKFGVKFDNGGGSVHCFYDDFTESLVKYLSRIRREDLLEENGVTSLDLKIKTLTKEKIEKTELVERLLPIGFREIFNDRYLDNRNFLSHHYQLFKPGICNDPILRNYIIFQEFQFGKRVGWQARSRYSKEWHKKNLKEYKEGKCSLKLRYNDAPGMDTSKILGGCDDLSDDTDTLILVEGRFDKIGIDKKLNLYQSNSIRCCFTFGNKIGDGQVKVIERFKSIKLIYLLYDEGTIRQVKDIALKLSKKYIVRAATMLTEKDPGDADVEDILTALETSTSAIEFFSSRIEYKIL